jgi:hypothetical protein
MLTAAIVCGFITLWLSRAEPLLKSWLAWKQTKPPVSAEWVPEPLPGDLLTSAMSESEKWAQEASLKSMNELYAQTRDWAAVRAALGVQRAGTI